ncbi:MAG: VCBS repeat-containing protein [Flavobacteriales bacterium]|nr:VCBS repeat-containing protein [Flavobacteriales bacterium]
MKNLPLYLSLLLLLTCSKEDSQDPGTTPSNITPRYTLTASTGEGGSVAPSTGSFNAGTQVSVTATPNSGYTFSGWSNGSTANPLTVTLNSNTSITANFALIPVYTITVSAEDGGSVSSNGGEYQQGIQVTLTATPNEGYEFSGWSDGSTEATRVITASENLTLTASFSELIISYTLTVTSQEGGSVNSEGGEYNEGTEITLTATESEGYRFIGWSDGSTEESITITLSEDTSIEALFELIPVYTVTVTAEGGEVTGAGEYQEGTEITLTASASEGFEFIRWSDGTLESTIELTIENDITIEAFFAIPPKIQLISEPLKMFTKGISDTLALSYNYSEGFDNLSISSQYGNVSIINEPNQGDTSGLISIEYITNLIENIDETSTISGSDIITITVNGYESLSTELSFQVRTQPEPQFKDYSLGTKETLNYFPHKLNIQKIRYLNQKDNQFTDVCWGENIIREYNRWGNVKDDLKNPVYADINNDGYFDIILHAVYQDGGIENYMIQDGFLEVYLYQEGEFVYSDILESHRYVNAFRIFPADFDQDGDVDLYILNSGRDANPFTGDRSVILENQFSNNKFVEHLLGQTHFTHGAAIVDIDQDGDLDIYESGRGGANYFSGIYRNLGNMNFLEVNNYIDGTHFFNSDFLDSEFNDIDGDGNIDKVGTYTEWGECPSDLPNNVPFCPSYNPLVFWGSNNGSLSFNDVSEIPKVNGFGVPLKIMFYDIDNDYKDEIILSRVGGSFWGDPNFYTGFYIQILDIDDNRNIIDVTNTYIENNQSVEGYCGPADYYLTSKISDLDNNGFIDLIGKSLYDSSNFLRWEWNGNKFMRVE